MMRTFLAFGFLVLSSIAASAQVTVSGQGKVAGTANIALATTAPLGSAFSLGWTELPNTNYGTVCPSVSTFPGIGGATGCTATMTAWNGGWADTKRARLEFWGGGHADYWGNEVYFVDLKTRTVGRMTDPVSGASVVLCPGGALNWSGSPNVPHGYNGMAYVPTIDKVFYTMGDMSRGTSSCTATALNDSLGRRWDAWTLDLSTIGSVTSPVSVSTAATAWQALDPSLGDGGTLTFSGGAGWGRDVGGLSEWATVTFDPIGDLVYVTDQFSMYTWNHTTNVGLFKASGGNLNTSSGGKDAGGLDPDNRRVLLTGGGPARLFNIADNTTIDLAPLLTNCSTPINANGPGLTWDASMKLFVLWDGAAGNTRRVWVMNPMTVPVTTLNYGIVPARTCVNVTLSLVSGTSDPAAAPAPGVFGRFQYFPNVNGEAVFATTNAISTNAHVLKLNDSGDWAYRSTRPGVIMANALSTQAQINQGSLNVNGIGNLEGSFDSSISPPLEGIGGSLKFNVPVNIDTPNMSGSWLSPIWNTAFGPPTHPGLSSTLYVQYRIRYDQNFAQTNFGANGYKYNILHNDGATCASIELTIQNNFNRGYPQMYTDCGGQDFATTVSSNVYHQQGTYAPPTLESYSCNNSAPTARTCSFNNGTVGQGYANKWMTIEEKVVFTGGEWNTSQNATVSVWFAYEDGPFNQIINFKPTLGCNTTPGCLSIGSNEGYDHITLLNYNTNKTASSNPNPQSTIWYCCVIVSTQPIPAPRWNVP